MYLSILILSYVLGGLTLLPLLTLLTFLHAYLTLPTSSPAKLDPSEAEPTVNSTTSPPEYPKDLPPGLSKQIHEQDVAAGYFAVTREFVPGGVNGKPPERTTPTGIVTESPSVYQSMYRSLFERGKSMGPTLDPKPVSSGGRQTRRARNVFYVVLRHGHLMLYDDVEQMEVRHVISLAHYSVDVYAGGEDIPEGELFIKRNCIRLTYNGASQAVHTKPFYLFSENSSEKEDFYHALLRSQDHQPSTDFYAAPTPLKFQQAHIIKLVQTLHASEETLQSRWINALVGRLFLGLYKTQEVEDFIRMKFTKKVARVSKPAFISHIKLQRVDMGDSAPILTNPKLRELTVDGGLTVEADVNYTGNFRIEIAAVARLDLGSRFKAREVNLVLAGILKKLSGHVLLRIKPPPSNRLWITFETMPHIDMSIEPVVSARQITYGIVLRTIESRIREVIAETIVHPNWDDIPFHNSTVQKFRGGIWLDDNISKVPADGLSMTAAAGLVDEFQEAESGSEEEMAQIQERDKSISMPSLLGNPSATLINRSGQLSALAHGGAAVSSSTDPSQSHRPRTMRSQSFASVAHPVISTDSAIVQPIKGEKSRRVGLDAATGLKDISSRSPMESPIGSLEEGSNLTGVQMRHHESFSSASSTDSQAHDENLTNVQKRPSTDTAASNTSGRATFARSPSHRNSASNTPPKSITIPNSTEKRVSVDAGISTVTAAAKKFFNNRRNLTSSVSASNSIMSTTPPGSTSLPPTSPSASSRYNASGYDNGQLGSPSHPIGRGQPLPPPGTPLPPPTKPRATWHAAPVGTGAIAGIGSMFGKRKAAPDQKQTTPQFKSVSLATRRLTGEPQADADDNESVPHSQRLPPPLPPRHTQGEEAEAGSAGEEIFVIAAPENGDEEVVGSLDLGAADAGRNTAAGKARPETLSVGKIGR